jgi:hypothetical protein
MGNPFFSGRIQHLRFDQFLVQFNLALQSFIVGKAQYDHITLAIAGNENGLFLFMTEIGNFMCPVA